MTRHCPGVTEGNSTMKRAAIVLVAGLVVISQSKAIGESCYETMVRSPTPFMGNNGEILKLSDGSVWEVKGAYEYLYEYYPAVIICPSRGKLIVEDKTIDVEPIASGKVAAEKDQGITESVIVSDFDGLEQGNIYKLANGEVWEQVEPWTWIWIWIGPTVKIYPASGGYKMKVQGIDHPVFVKRLN